jgi:hypothetical protein
VKAGMAGYARPWMIHAEDCGGRWSLGVEFKQVETAASVPAQMRGWQSSKP